MRDTPDDLLLLEADHLARDLLLTAGTKPRTLPGLITGWERLIPAAAAITGTQVPNPLSQVLQISVATRRDANDWIGSARADSRLDRMRELLDDVTTASGSPDAGARLAEATLHTCYLATHAVSSSLARHADQLLRVTKTRPQGMLVKSLGQRIEAAEHILDAELHDPGLTVSGPTDAARALRQRISDWDQELHAALASRTPDPRVLLVSANVAAGLLRATAELAQRAAGRDTTNSPDVETRLLPVLVAAIDSWDRSRETWRLLAPAASGIPRPLANAAHRLYEALHDPALDTHADIQRALRLSIMATVEAAHLQVQATRRADLRGAASGVASLTRKVFDHVPGAQSLDLWHQLERLNGPALISIPTPVRTELLGDATVTLATTTTAASASYVLSRGTGGHRGKESDHHGQVRPWHAHATTHPGLSHAPRP